MTDVVTTQVVDRVLLITLNRPQLRNAINHALAAALVAAVQRLDEDPTLAVGVLTGSGSGFCAGMDLKAFGTKGIPTELGKFIRNGSRKPLIAAVEGFALAGGLELAITCDVIVAAEGAQLGLPEARVGMVAAGGGLIRIGRFLPYGTAMEFVLTGLPISAEVAAAQGLVTRLVEPGTAVQAALQLAKVIAANAPLALEAAKQIVRESKGQTEAELWELQAPLARQVFRSEDAREGARAFAERRPPSWVGR